MLEHRSERQRALNRIAAKRPDRHAIAGPPAIEQGAGARGRHDGMRSGATADLTMTACTLTDCLSSAAFSQPGRRGRGDAMKTGRSSAAEPAESSNLESACPHCSARLGGRALSLSGRFAVPASGHPEKSSQHCERMTFAAAPQMNTPIAGKYARCFGVGVRVRVGARAAS